MGISAGLDAFALTFTISPIILTGGIAAGMGGILPIVAITEALNFTEGLLSGGDELDLDDFFAHFVPPPGATLVENEFGRYPFGNQAVAANAVIRMPRRVSMRMICPAKGEGGYAIKLATMLALEAALSNHNAQGGTYIVATPSFFFTNCVLLRVPDVSNNASAQAQNSWQFDFEQPLLTLQDAQAAQNNLIAQITGGVPIPGLPSWGGAGLIGSGIPPNLTGIGSIPASSGVGGAQSAAPFQAVAQLT